MKEDYELLKKYLQNEIDTGNNKTFIFDKDDVIDFKNCNALSYIENMEKEKERLQKENKKLKLCLGIVSPSRVLLEGKYWEKEDNKEIERLHSIIKEVREYVEEYRKNKEKYKLPNVTLCSARLLEILDKEEKE